MSSRILVPMLLVSAVLATACGKPSPTLRVERVEIVDQTGATKMDVAKEIQTLEDRLQKAEAAVAKLEADARTRAAVPAAPAAPPTPVAAPSPAASQRPRPAASGLSDHRDLF